MNQYIRIRRHIYRTVAVHRGGADHRSEPV